MNNNTGVANFSKALVNVEKADDIQSIMIKASLLIIFMATIAFIVNVYLMICSFFLRRPLTVNLRLCLSLTASDAASAFFYILSLLVNVIIPSITGQADLISNCFVLVLECFKIATFFASVFNLLVLALNHYIGIVYPLNRYAITSKTVKFAILIAYLFPIMGMLTLFSVMPGIGFQADKPFAFFTRNGCKGNSIFKEVSVRWVIVTPFVLFVVIIAFLYFHILWHMNKLSKDPVLTKFGSNCNKRKNSKRLLVTIMLLAGSAIVGWLPTLFQYVLFCQNCPVALPFEATFYVSVGAQFLNVLKFIADAFIYASRLVEVRYAIWMFHATILNYIPCCSHLKIEVPQAFNKYLSETKERRSMNSSKRIVLERMRQVGINSSFNTKSVRYVTSTPEQQSLLPIHPSSTIVTNDKKVFINRKSSFKTNIDNSQS